LKNVGSLPERLTGVVFLLGTIVCMVVDIWGSMIIYYICI
jgi:hypothetical protein